MTQVLCIGEILYDYLAADRGKSIESVSSWIAYPGGAPANVASALVKLGTSAGFIGCIGKDEAGQSLKQLLLETGVNCQGIQEHPTAPTRGVYVLRSESGDREFAGFGNLPRDQFADAFLNPDEIPVPLFEQAQFLVLGTLELAYPTTRKAIFRALDLANTYNIKVLVDVNWRPMFWNNPDEAIPLIHQLWESVDFIKLSREEAELLFDTKESGAIAHQIASLEGVFITDGDNTISYCLNEFEGKIPAFEMPVEDTTGAGDSFVAGLVHQLCQKGLNHLDDPTAVKEMITYACAVGGLTTTKSGAMAAQPTAAEVEEFLKGG
ncbi:carbohydrate kinase [Euhalothece natronophila Z-M001]|uniref:Carbohydrate kinase n=1 Tax=Euhalothece natronophila Z-M001 TaxID=522448 RepID=A0A5B8NJA1_9CHRO|nr:carbohydrate kinase [Euhalothece natronophila]QDZ39363.1 carbohydrate kinase [Euhalothece natronophila Z-M001]